MFKKMKTFKMYVKTTIYNEQDKILLLKKKEEEDNKPIWDLPGSLFTEEQSFDETVINNVQKEIGYYVYPGKIIGISDYSDKQEKEVNVIMEGTILNGELLLSKDYETHTWVAIDRISDYPLAPWLNEYIRNNKNPFKDIETEIEEITSQKQSRRGSIQPDLWNPFKSRDKSEDNTNNNTTTVDTGAKSSFSILKDAIKRTFHPQQVHVTQTTPTSEEIHQNITEEETEDDNFVDKLNIRFKKEDKEEEEYLNEIISKDNTDDIIIDHNEKNTTDDIIIDHNEKNTTDDIIIEHDKKDTATENIDPVVKEEKTVSNEEIILKPKFENKKIFDMNINRQQNMRSSIDKIKNPIKKQVQNITSKEPEIKIIRKNEETPHIRTEKESKEKVSFNSENINRIGWKERLNRINRTEANNTRKEAPRPKGQRK